MPESPRLPTLWAWPCIEEATTSPRSAFEEAIKLSAKNKQAENPTHHYHLGPACEKAKKTSASRQHFEHVLRIDPNYSEAAKIRKQRTKLKS